MVVNVYFRGCKIPVNVEGESVSGLAEWQVQDEAKRILIQELESLIRRPDGESDRVDERPAYSTWGRER